MGKRTICLKPLIENALSSSLISPHSSLNEILTLCSTRRVPEVLSKFQQKLGIYSCVVSNKLIIIDARNRTVVTTDLPKTKRKAYEKLQAVSRNSSQLQCNGNFELFYTMSSNHDLHSKVKNNPISASQPPIVHSQTFPMQ